MTHIADLQRRTGSEAVYVESPAICRVCVDRVDTQEKGISVALSVLRIAGFTPTPRDAWISHASWEEFQFSEHTWLAPNVSWQFYFDLSIIEALSAFASDIPQVTSEVGRFVLLAKELQRLSGCSLFSLCRSE